MRIEDLELDEFYTHYGNGGKVYQYKGIVVNPYKVGKYRLHGNREEIYSPMFIHIIPNTLRPIYVGIRFLSQLKKIKGKSDES